MNKSLQNFIDDYTNGRLETKNLQICNENFSTEVICDEHLSKSFFGNLNLANVNFTNIDFYSSIFTDCSFDKCCFERAEKGCLKKGWFESCDLVDTDFKDFDELSLLMAALVDSKFSKFNKSIEFKGEFFLADILYSENGITKMFIE